ncbi:hypothetical protein MesoLj113b_57650 [Mesorhizobium sp. 113-3-3]|nr:hypothetical protein MesoLj113b_57650 [Mesorhizobium sp. 113-3-3]
MSCEIYTTPLRKALSVRSLQAQAACGHHRAFALVQEPRSWFAGPLALSGTIATGRAIIAAKALGADLTYVGSAFIATQEANATLGHK